MLSCQLGDLFRPDLAWPGPVDNLAEIAAEVTTSAFAVYRADVVTGLGGAAGQPALERVTPSM